MAHPTPAAWWKQQRKQALSFAKITAENAVRQSALPDDGGVVLTADALAVSWKDVAPERAKPRLTGESRSLFMGCDPAGVAPVSEPVIYAVGKSLRLFRETIPDAEALFPFVVVVDGNDDAGYGGYVVGFDAAVNEAWQFEPMKDGFVLRHDRESSSAFILRFDGTWQAGLQTLARELKSFPALDKAIGSVVEPLLHGLANHPDLELFFTALAEWVQDDGKFNSPSVGWRQYLVRRLKRRDRLLSDPRLASTLANGILFYTRASPYWQHTVAQYFGWHQCPGGDILVLTEPGRSMRTRNLTGGKFPRGSFLEPALSYDARKILFSFVATEGPIPSNATKINEEDENHHFYHLWEMGVDGGGLRQLTNDRYEDILPCWLADGDIAFMSTRRQSMSRCFGRSYSTRWQSYTLHRMKPDGTDLRRLSWNDTAEWFPVLNNDGEIIFARWDYIDRDAVRHQNLWAMRPDGTNPRALWGNETMTPQCTFQAKPIPGSGKIVCVAAAHHATTGGPLILIDPSVDENSQAAVTRITPGHYAEVDMPAPEDRRPYANNDWYNSPWPYGEDLFLVSWCREALKYQPAWPNPDFGLGLYVLHADGTREVLYRDCLLSAGAPQPLVPRSVPPLLVHQVDAKLATAGKGEVFIADVYRGLPAAKRGTIRKVRVVQVFPRTQPEQFDPLMGGGGHENGRAVLGEVDVETDGSARFLVPASKPILFQVLDAEGNAWRTMRSSTSLMPGERVSCVGCHESKREAAAAERPLALAMKRTPQNLSATAVSGRPWGFVENVQPIFDRKCVSCHGDEKPAAGLSLTRTTDPRLARSFTRSYVSLCFEDKPRPGPWREYQELDNWIRRRHRCADGKVVDMVPCHLMYNTLQTSQEGPGVNALGSGLLEHLRNHPGHARLLTALERRMIATWIDLNACFLGVCEEPFVSRQRRGEPVPMPTIQ